MYTNNLLALKVRGQTHLNLDPIALMPADSLSSVESTAGSSVPGSSEHRHRSIDNRLR